MTEFAGTRALTGLAFRRDRFWLVAYVVGLSAFLGATAAMFAAGPQSTVTDGVKTFATNAAVRMMGLASGDSVGAYALLRDSLLLGVLAGLISALTVVRHTRQDEETGRAELVGAGALGRYASLASALIVTVAANIVLAIVLAASLIINGLSVPASLVAGASISLVGVVFAGVAAVTAQLSSTSRGASGFAAAVLGIAFLVGGVGNMLGNPDASGLRVDPAWPTWLSPIGWGELMRPFAGNHLLPLLVAAVVFACLVGTAAVLVNRRDVGAGILAERRCNAEAAPGLLSPLGLVWRLQRGALLGWAIGMTGFGIVFGAMAKNVQTTGGASARWYMRVGGSHQILDAYRTSIIEMVGAAVAVYVVQMLLRMHADETDGQLEPILSTAVSRPRWMASHLMNAGIGAAALLLLFTISMGLTMGADLGNTGAQLRVLLEAAAVQLPAIVVVGGIVVAATALLPRWTSLISWTYVGITIIAGPIFGAATLQLPRWLQDISPFTLVPKLPGAPFSALAVLGLTALATALLAGGLIVFRRRNLVLPV
jgi:ABC-2 type transport system permease protein